MIPVPGTCFFLKHLPKLLAQIRQACPAQPLNFHHYRVVHRLLSVTVNHRSHERSFPANKQVWNLGNLRITENRRDEPAAGREGGDQLI
jgi:hypothetical protein